MSGQQQQNHTINMMANGMMPNMMGQGSVGMVGMTQPPNTMMAQGMQVGRSRIEIIYTHVLFNPSRDAFHVFR